MAHQPAAREHRDPGGGGDHPAVGPCLASPAWAPPGNPERTLTTSCELSAKAPDSRCCVATNGLALLAVAAELCQRNIDHVTITINRVAPKIAREHEVPVQFDYQDGDGRPTP